MTVCVTLDNVTKLWNTKDCCKILNQIVFDFYPIRAAVPLPHKTHVVANHVTHPNSLLVIQFPQPKRSIEVKYRINVRRPTRLLRTIEKFTLQLIQLPETQDHRQ